MESPCGCSGSLKVWVPASLVRELLDAPLFCSMADALLPDGLSELTCAFLWPQYAHRGCVQRWCDEKGSTLCEICLQVRTPLIDRHPALLHHLSSPILASVILLQFSLFPTVLSTRVSPLLPRACCNLFPKQQFNSVQFNSSTLSSLQVSGR